jgi:predicted 2-oxoglutarate/Fe(II)-dependent dioxygenase YbiX
MSPLMMNRYGEGMEHGDHGDAAILGGTTPMRADVSATLFICDPADYDSGELVTQIMPRYGMSACAARSSGPRRVPRAEVGNA